MIDKKWIKEQFKVEDTALDGFDILYCISDLGDYEELINLILKKGNQLYYLRASHCSCYGFEDQWKPEEVTTEELKKYHNDDIKWQSFVSTLS